LTTYIVIQGLFWFHKFTIERSYLCLLFYRGLMFFWLFSWDNLFLECCESRSVDLKFLHVVERYWKLLEKLSWSTSIGLFFRNIDQVNMSTDSFLFWFLNNSWNPSSSHRNKLLFIELHDFKPYWVLWIKNRSILMLFFPLFQNWFGNRYPFRLLIPLCLLLYLLTNYEFIVIFIYLLIFKPNLSLDFFNWETFWLTNCFIHLVS